MLVTCQLNSIDIETDLFNVICTVKGPQSGNVGSWHVVLKPGAAAHNFEGDVTEPRPGFWYASGARDPFYPSRKHSN